MYEQEIKQRGKPVSIRVIDYLVDITCDEVKVSGRRKGLMHFRQVASRNNRTGGVVPSEVGTHRNQFVKKLGCTDYITHRKHTCHTSVIKKNYKEILHNMIPSRFTIHILDCKSRRHTHKLLHYCNKSTFGDASCNAAGSLNVSAFVIKLST